MSYLNLIGKEWGLLVFDYLSKYSRYHDLFLITEWLCMQVVYFFSNDFFSMMNILVVPL